MNKQEMTGLWEKQSEKGTIYYSGTAVIGGKEYFVNLFNSNSDNPKAPKFNIGFVPKTKKY